MLRILFIVVFFILIKTESKCEELICFQNKEIKVILKSTKIKRIIKNEFRISFGTTKSHFEIITPIPYYEHNYGYHSFEEFKFENNVLKFDINISGSIADYYNVEFHFKNNKFELCHAKQYRNMYGSYDYWFGTSKYILNLNKEHTTNLYVYYYLDTKFGKYEIGFGNCKANKHELKIKNEQGEMTVFLPYTARSYIPQSDFSIVCNLNNKTKLMYDFSIHTNQMWYCDSITNFEANKVKVLNIKLYNKQTIRK